ncbi:MAG: PDZ domain-containing protein, partial [Alphaproteobacteria bacterium]|nr:PDZ domain-containing protein [Alphaproteobacteria bacterium]
MTPNFKNPLTVLSVLCWFVIACLAVAVMLNTRTIENLDTAQNRAQADRDLLKRDIAQAREETAQAARALAQKAIVMEQTQAAEAQDLRDSVTQLRDEVSTLKRTIDDNRVAAERASAALHSQLNRQKPVTFASARSMPATGGMHIDGNGGRDVMNGWSNLLHLDGSRLTSLEIFNLVDGRRNEVRVMAPGLNDLEEDFMELRLDPALDSVLLDRCLGWQKDGAPISEELKKKFDTAAGAYIWTATDAEGQTRRVAITADADVQIAAACDNDYAAQVAARDAREKDAPKQKLQPEDAPAQHYNPDAATGAQTYRAWAEATENPRIKSALSLIAAQVQAGKLPPEFLSNRHNAVVNESDGRDGRTLMPLPLNPAQGPFLGDGSLRLSAGGLQVVIAAPGDERIDADSDTTLLVLDKKWGSKKLQKTCPKPKTARDEQIFRQLPAVPVFSGIGLRLAQNGDSVLSAGAMPGSPAEKAGIAPGDRLVAINGAPLPAALADVVALIRGEA